MGDDSADGTIRREPLVYSLDPAALRILSPGELFTAQDINPEQFLLLFRANFTEKGPVTILGSPNSGFLEQIISKGVRTEDEPFGQNSSVEISRFVTPSGEVPRGVTLTESDFRRDHCASKVNMNYLAAAVVVPLDLGRQTDMHFTAIDFKYHPQGRRQLPLNVPEGALVAVLYTNQHGWAKGVGGKVEAFATPWGIKVSGNPIKVSEILTLKPTVLWGFAHRANGEGGYQTRPDKEKGECTTTYFRGDLLLRSGQSEPGPKLPLEIKADCVNGEPTIIPGRKAVGYQVILSSDQLSALTTRVKDFVGSTQYDRFGPARQTA
jgi:hypothetical protein